jgi:Domain of unknown function (DUF4383)
MNREYHPEWLSWWFVAMVAGYPASARQQAGLMWKDLVPVLSNPSRKGPFMARRSDSAPASRHPSQLLALAIGAVYTAIGILGFLVTGFDNFAAETDKTLLGFEVNPLHNLVHLAIGLAGLALWRRLDTARAYGWLLAAGYGLTFIYGLFAAGNSDINFLSINSADNVLHLLSAAAGLAIALWPAQRAARRSLADRGA